MGFWDNAVDALKTAAGQGEEVTKHVFKQLLEHPEVAVLGPVGLAFAGASNLAQGRNLFGRAGDRPHTTKHAPPMPSGAYGPGKLAGLLGVAMAQGKTIAGTQPYAVTSYYGAASASAVTKNSDIADMFASTNCTAFTQADTFPWPFQSYRMRWSYTSILGILTTTNAATAASPGDPAWIKTLHAVFSNATEIARVALSNLGLKITLLGAQGYVATAAQAFGLECDEQPGVLWPVFYEKNGSYVMSVRTDHAIGTIFAPFQISTQLDGWVINDPTVLDADVSQVQSTVDALMQSGYGQNTVSVMPKSIR